MTDRSPTIGELLGMDEQSLAWYMDYVRRTPQEVTHLLAYREDLISNVEQLMPLLHRVCGEYESSLGTHITNPSCMGLDEVCTAIALLNGMMRYAAESAGMIDRLDRYFKAMSHQPTPVGEA